MSVSGLATAINGFVGYYDFGFESTFSLVDLTNIASFTNLYDQYKILGIRVDITYLQNSSETGNTHLLPTLNIVTDQDDNVMPTSGTQLLGKQGARKFTFGSKGRTKFSMYFKPGVRGVVSLANNSPVTASIPQSKPWLDCIQNTIPHYAIKGWVENAEFTANNFWALQFDFTYDIAFKQPLQCS